MKPTLYAEDVATSSGGAPIRALQAIVRTLPRRCPNTRCVDGWDSTDTALFPNGRDCMSCDGLGFLYPDPPEWWPPSKAALIRWREEQVPMMWRVLGIVEVDDE